MGAWKAEAGEVDDEAERVDRQKAALGEEGVARLKDLNVFIIGCRGVGVETAKNLILSNVGGVVVWDPAACRIQDMGTNFYVRDNHVAQGTPRSEACLSELKSLNPHCKVDVYNGELSDEFLTQTNVMLTGKPFKAVVVTHMLPQEELFRLNETARANDIAFVMAINTGVTASLFSDFGPAHAITDVDGEPVTTMAMSNLEIVKKTPLLKVSGVNDGEDLVIITVATDNHGLDDGSIVSFDDMGEGGLAALNGQKCRVKRLAFVSPSEAKVDMNEVSTKELLKGSTDKVLESFLSQYNYYKAESEKANTGNNKKFQTRELTLFSRFALDFSADADGDTAMDSSGFKTLPFSEYQQGGLVTQVRPTVTKGYKTLSETLESLPLQMGNPKMLFEESTSKGVGIDIHLAYAAVLRFEAEQKHWPRLHSSEDANAVIAIAKAISEERHKKAQSAEGICWAQRIEWGFPSGEPRDLDEQRIGRFAKYFEAELTGFCAFLGGAGAQEVLKKTGKFTPLEQWLHHDDHSLITDECPMNLGPLTGTRYDYQIAVLGKDFQQRAANFRVFLVGCGALGCEFLKGLALMGVGTNNKRGKVWVTDMDNIEVSNLSRQFLFRAADVKKAKSVTGARVVKEWNPKVNVEALEKRVGDDSEDFFSDQFWSDLDMCWNALDNVHARKYTDARCLFYSKPLLESGTLGTKCNADVILPFRTQSYNDGKESDDNENQIAMCTLRSYPFLPLHCIEFAKQAYFSDYYEFGPSQYESFRKDMDGFFESLDSMGGEEKTKALSLIQKLVALQDSGTKKVDFTVCVEMAFGQMQKDFRSEILDLVYNCDKLEESSGKPFWTGTKRRPRAADWNNEEMKAALMEYLYSAANLYAFVWGVPYVRNRQQFEATVQAIRLTQPEWKPPSGDSPAAKAADDEEDGKEGDEDGGPKVLSDEDLYRIQGELRKVNTAVLQPATPHDFEKDEDDNFHIDFLTIATNMRSWTYLIKESARHHVKITAGRIIPAMATTTAMVCGLVDMEFCKLVLGLQNFGREPFLNSNINLATGLNAFNAFNPDPAIQIESNCPSLPSYTSWDKLEIDAPVGGELSLKQLVEQLRTSYGIETTNLTIPGHEKTTLYSQTDALKMNWTIEMVEGKLVLNPEDEILKSWPQLNMAKRMLDKLPEGSGQRKMFEMQVKSPMTSLANTKQSFLELFEGPISKAVISKFRPELSDEVAEILEKEKGQDSMEVAGGQSESQSEAVAKAKVELAKQGYFDVMCETRDYIILVGDFTTMSDGQDASFPMIKYNYRL